MIKVVNVIEECPSCQDKSIKHRVVMDESDDSQETYWVLVAGIVEISISFCPYCGFPLLTGLRQEDLSV